MGSTLSRNIRDLFDVAGCDGISHLDTSIRDGADEDLTSNNETGGQLLRPSTPVPHHRTRLLGQDPRSPSVEIVRTPIEVMATPFSNKSSNGNKLENSEGETQRNYLETDLDKLHDPKSEAACTPVGGSSKVGHLPPGLSTSHLLKLKFLGMDPRSPSEGIVRTPIQVPHHHEDSADESSINSRACDTSSMCSSRSLFDCSDEYLDISKACTEPSAVLSDYEITKDWDLSLGVMDYEEQEITSTACNEEPSSEQIEERNEGVGSVLSSSGQELTASTQKDISLLKEKVQQSATLSKATAGVVIYREESRTPKNTPKRKSTRTPLTPICNLTPNDVKSRKTKGKHLEKDKLVCKILSGNENTPTTLLVKRDKKSLVDENSKLVEWDQDTTVII